MNVKMSTIEHNPSALRGFLNNPKWYAYGHRLKLSPSQCLNKYNSDSFKCRHCGIAVECYETKDTL